MNTDERGFNREGAKETKKEERGKMNMLKTDIDELQIGDWCFQATIGPDGIRRRDSYIALRFLDGDRGLAILPIALEWPAEPGETYESVSYTNIHGQACWEWNGSKDRPTLSPSILHWGDGKDQPATWHGFLRDGQLVEA